MDLKIGIVTVSDRASSGVYEDISGKAIQEVLTSYIQNKWEKVYKLIPDEQDLIQSTLIDLVDNQKCSLVVTTGGTGPAARDVTPEATQSVCEKMMPGFGELMRMESLKYVPTAILSRQTAGIRKQCLIVNLPGKPKSIKECLEVVFPAIPYCVDLINGAYIKENTNNIKVFRPKQ
jgi:molybdopterin adenylyltransferase